jgi:ribosome maturation factor RimP
LRRQEHFEAVVGRRIKLRAVGQRKLRGEVLSAGDQSVTVAVSDGAETEIPYAEIVRANLIDEGVT